MPYITEEKTLTVEQIVTVGFECDRCKKKVYNNKDSWESFEYGERVSVSFTGGYTSVWGDNTKVDVVICQQCGYELFKDFARTEDTELW